MFLSAPQDGAKLTKTDRPGKHAPNKRGNTTVARNLGGAGAGATARILGSRGAGVGFVAVGDAPPRFGFAELVASGNKFSKAAHITTGHQEKGVVQKDGKDNPARRKNNVPAATAPAAGTKASPPKNPRGEVRGAPLLGSMGGPWVDH